MEDLNEILQTVCHTSERTFDGTVYTLSDARFPEYDGKKIIVRLRFGKHVAQWVEGGDDEN